MRDRPFNQLWLNGRFVFYLLLRWRKRSPSVTVGLNVEWVVCLCKGLNSRWGIFALAQIPLDIKMSLPVSPRFFASLVCLEGSISTATRMAAEDLYLFIVYLTGSSSEGAAGRTVPENRYFSSL